MLTFTPITSSFVYVILPLSFFFNRLLSPNYVRVGSDLTKFIHSMSLEYLVFSVLIIMFMVWDIEIKVQRGPRVSLQISTATWVS